MLVSTAWTNNIKEVSGITRRGQVSGQNLLEMCVDLRHWAGSGGPSRQGSKEIVFSGVFRPTVELQRKMAVKSSAMTEASKNVSARVYGMSSFSVSPNQRFGL